MKRITLVRHAKSSWDDPNQSDFNRPLNARGKKAAPLMANVLLERSHRPELLISSPAARALSTARLFAEILGYGEEDILQEPRIYEASWQTLLGIVRNLPSAARYVCFFGHNPGFQELANILLPAPLAKLPTCGVVDMHLSVAEWEMVGPGTVTSFESLFPKMFGGEDD